MWHRGFRLSPTGIEALRQCPRKYQLDRLKTVKTHEGNIIYDDSPQVHFDYGKGMEEGITSYLIHGSLDRALVDMWLAYDVKYESENKTLESLVSGLKSFALSWPINEWALEKPQLGFKIDFEDEFGGYYCGYIDAVIRNVNTGTLATIECKTTGGNGAHLEAGYQNTEQALAYPAITSFVTKNKDFNLACLYVIAVLNRQWVPKIEFKSFPKTRSLMLEWLLGLKLTYENELKKYVELDFWPMRGTNCKSYNKPCYHFGVCHLASPNAPADPDFWLDNLPSKEEEEEFDYVIKFSELFNWINSLD